jgi:hypothetical protein
VQTEDRMEPNSYPGVKIESMASGLPDGRFSN